MESFIVLISILLGLLTVYYFFFRKPNIFKVHDVPQIKQLVVSSNFMSVMIRRKSVAAMIQWLYNDNPEAKYVGFYDYLTPTVIIRDPELIKSVTVKNFDNFTDHHNFFNLEQDSLFSKNLVGLEGDRWRSMRAVLSPSFTSSKMKFMFKLMSECARNFADLLTKLPEEERVVEVKDIFAKYTVDVIATCAFGISVDSMKDPKNEFYVYGRNAINFDTAGLFKATAIRMFPRLCSMLGIRLVKKDVEDFFKKIVETTVRTREEKGITRPDMIQLMMESRDRDNGLSIDEITSQAFVFFFAGFDSTSTTLAFVAHEIAANPDVQERLQNEIDGVLEETGDEVTYEAINGMEYLDAVLSEALRMYPIAVIMDRKCTRDFELPPALPGRKPFVIKEGAALWIPVYGLHHDPQYFEEPAKFCPERFLGKDKKIAQSGFYLPFGSGPRMCIGNRFALLETKVLLFHLLARCELKPCEKTSIPLKLSKTAQMGAENGFWLMIQPRNNSRVSVSPKANSEK